MAQSFLLNVITGFSGFLPIALFLAYILKTSSDPPATRILKLFAYFILAIVVGTAARIIAERILGA